MQNMWGDSVLTYISTVFFFTKARKSIQYEVKRYPTVETGGILMGVPLSNGNFLVTHATSAGPNAIRKPNTFKKDWCYTLNVLDYLEKRRSEERRVGKECRYRGSAYYERKKEK